MPDDNFNQQYIEHISTILSYLKKVKWNSRRNGITCLCPFHKDNTPSFGINFSKGVFNCFSCSKSGTLNDLIKYLNIPIYINIKHNSKLLKQIQIQNVKEDCSLDKFLFVLKEIEQKLSNSIVEEENFYYLKQHWYLDERDLSKEIIEKYNIRYKIHKTLYDYSIGVNKDKIAFINAKPFKELEGIIIPIYNYSNKIIGYVIRHTHNKLIKYKYSSGFMSANNFYNLNYYKGQRTVFITEGIFDCIKASTFLTELNLIEYIHPISSFSCTNFNNKHVRILKKLGVENIIIGFDNDNAGKLGTDNIVKEYGKKFKNVFILDWGEYNDIKDIDNLKLEEFDYIINNLKKVK